METEQLSLSYFGVVKEKYIKSRKIELITFFVGGVLIIAGFVIGIKLYVDYLYRFDLNSHSWFTKDSNFQDLATSLAGTCGLCWALAGTFFFLYTIFLTKTEIKLQIQEMNQTNSTLKAQYELNYKQQNESTFFNLINNQKIMVSNYSFGNLVGIEALNENIKELNSRLLVYKESIINRRFESFEYTKYSPENLFDNYDQLSTLADYETHLIRFIISNLKDDDFYHRTYFYNLSNSEKFIIGFVIENKIYELEDQLSYYYTEYYKYQTNFISIDMNGYFPLCDLRIPAYTSCPIKIEASDSFKGFLDSATNYVVLANEYIDLKRIELRYRSTIETMGLGGKETSFEEHISIQKEQFNSFNLGDLANCRAFIKVCENTFSITLEAKSFYVIITYNEQEYLIKLPLFSFTFSKRRDVETANLLFN